MKTEPGLRRVCLAEMLGTFILVFCGTGAVAIAVFAGALSGLWQVAAVWVLGVALAVYVTVETSGAHLNPAVTLALAVFRGFPRGRILPYWIAQLAGAILAAALVYFLFQGHIAEFERAHNLVRGAAGSEWSAKAFGEYFPDPGGGGRALSVCQAMLAEAAGTALLLLSIFALTDPKNSSRPAPALTPLCIGVTVGLIILLVAPLTQAGLNPARDFGPRLFSYFAGWGRVAIPGPHGGFFVVYILGPLLGGLCGGGLYQWVAPRVLETKQSLKQVDSAA